ncbi:MAG: cation acetate symporter [Oceanospirillaceae bacterium]|jgi:cation/acetate symporter|nr:cation acetate symporter [Oceanospirillaceae bacterium]MBT4442906.1 cation acetate symporter [Oceanospirillaceae bacterium]MBT6076884.1 cation acetate symporter [Oceanospirillaceae bacterium]
MSLEQLTYLFVVGSFFIYITIAIWSRASSTREFYVAGGGVTPLANGMATAADWMSAASFISLAGIISFAGYDASGYIMGWTGGYVLLALLLAPYLRKFGKFTVPDFVGDRYYSKVARVVAVICVMFISFTYIAGQMRGTGIVFSRFLQVEIDTGVMIGMAVVFVYAVLGGMKGITYTQVAQYCVMIFAFTVPALFLTFSMTGHVLPQTGLGATLANGETVLGHLDGLVSELGFSSFTEGSKSSIDMFFITASLMFGTAGLPHVIVRFFTVPRVRDARISAAWALVFIALLYSSIPAVAAFGRINLIETVNGVDNQGTRYEEMPQWFKKWENAGLIAWYDHNADGRTQYAAGDAFTGRQHKPIYWGAADDTVARNFYYNQRHVVNPSDGSFDPQVQPFANEIYVDPDIMVLANPEIAELPDWVIALIAAGAMAAALSTAAGLLLVIATAVSHDLLKKTFRPQVSDGQELMAARLAAMVAVVIAGYVGMHPPDYVAAVVALAFGLACASFFPVIIMGIFYQRMNKYGAISGMLVGLLSTLGYIVYFKFFGGEPEDWLLGISPEGFGAMGMVLNFIVAYLVAHLTPQPPKHIQQMVQDIRVPRNSGSAYY